MALVSLFVVIVKCSCPGRAVDTGKCPVVECSSEGLYAGVTQQRLFVASNTYSKFNDFPTVATSGLDI